MNTRQRYSLIDLAFALRRRWKRAQAQRRMAMLDDRTLCDIGLSRGSVLFGVTAGFE